MAECAVCGAHLDEAAARGATCPGCGASLVSSRFHVVAEDGDDRPGGRARRDSSTAGVPPGATHRYEIQHRYDLEPGLRPVSVVLDGDELLVLALIQDQVTVARYGIAGGLRRVLGRWDSGDGPEQIGDPAGIALDDHGNTLILDGRWSRVQKIDGTGRIVAGFGSEGLGDQQLSYPRDLEVTDRGMLLADTANNRVQCWTLDGAHLRTIGPAIDEDEDTTVPSGTGPGEFDNPMGVTADDGGRIFVADTNNHRVQVFSADGRYEREYGSEGAAPGHLLFPTDVRVADDGTFVVFDLHSRRVQKFQPDGTLIYALVLAGEGPDSVVGAIGDIDVGDDGSIFVPVPGESAVLRCRWVEG